MEATTAGVSPEAEHAHFEAPSGVVARIQHVLHTRPVLSPIAVLVLTSIVFTIFGKGNFQGSVNIGNTLQQTMPVAILAIGQTLVILTAGIDLSVGTAMLLAHMIVAKSAVDSGLNPVMCLLLGLLAGVAMGALNGILVTRVKLPPFIVTLGTFFVFTSIGLIYAEARTIRSDDMPSLLSWTGRTFKIGSIQLSYNVVLVLLMYVLFSFILSNTSWGRHVYAIGDDPEASRLAGINVTACSSACTSWPG